VCFVTKSVAVTQCYFCTLLVIITRHHFGFFIHTAFKVSLFRPRVHCQLQLRNYLVSWMEHTASYDTFPLPKQCQCAHCHKQQCAPSMQLNSSANKVATAHQCSLLFEFLSHMCGCVAPEISLSWHFK
jgi:hypothetical protein